MKGKTYGKGSEKAPDEKAEHNVSNSRVDTLYDAEDEDQGFSKGGVTKKKKKHHREMHGKKAHERGDKKMRRGKYADGGHVGEKAKKVDGRSVKAMADGSDKKKVESEARKVKMRPEWSEYPQDREDD